MNGNRRSFENSGTLDARLTASIQLAGSCVANRPAVRGDRRRKRRHQSFLLSRGGIDREVHGHCANVCRHRRCRCRQQAPARRRARRTHAWRTRSPRPAQRCIERERDRSGTSRLGTAAGQGRGPRLFFRNRPTVALVRARNEREPRKPVDLRRGGAPERKSRASQQSAATGKQSPSDNS